MVSLLRGLVPVLDVALFPDIEADAHRTLGCLGVKRILQTKELVFLLFFLPSFAQVQELAAPPRTLQVLRECIRACMHATYECLSDNVQALYGGNFQVTYLSPIVCSLGLHFGIF